MLRVIVIVCLFERLSAGGAVRHEPGIAAAERSSHRDKFLCVYALSMACTTSAHRLSTHGKTAAAAAAAAATATAAVLAFPRPNTTRMI